jgi:hypothetical protein
MANERLREVIREYSFEDELHVLIRDHRAADEFVEGAEFLLARNPELGSMARLDPQIWLMPMAPVEGKQVTLYYTFDDTTVILLGIREGPGANLTALG